MAALTVPEFERQIAAVCEQSKIILLYLVLRVPATSIVLRVYLTNGLFIDVFYNEVTGRVSYALVDKDRRIFGGGQYWGLAYSSF